MKIAQIAPLDEAVPPKLYGGSERIVSYLTEELVAQGHEVTLFAAAGSVTAARLVAMRDCALRLDAAASKSTVAAHMCLMHDLREQVDDFDILHFHTDMFQFPLFEAYAGRTVTTMHGRLDMKDLSGIYRRWFTYPLVSISLTQRIPLPFANWLANVPHGIDPTPLYLPERSKGDYLAFLGRICPEKRPDRAIAIARAVGMPLKMAAKVDPADKEYFAKLIKPLLAGTDIDFVGEICEAEKADFLGNARALLFPIDWPEPFGLVMIEAMACGTPVIAWRHGSVPEVIEDGVTGFIVDDMAAAIRAVGLAGDLDRTCIRRIFEDRFTVTAMTRTYVDLYDRIHHPRAPDLTAVYA